MQGLLKKLDEQDLKFLREHQGPATIGELTPRDIIGFELPEPRVIVPYVACSVPTISLWTLLPLYQCIIYPLSASFGIRKQKKIKKISDFKMVYGLTPDEFALMAEKGRVIPYITGKYATYDEKVIAPILEPGIPRITHHQLFLVNRFNLCKATEGDCEKCTSIGNLAKKDLGTVLNLPKLQESTCQDCLHGLYLLGLRDKLLSLPEISKNTFCIGHFAMASRNLGSVLETDCPAANDILTSLSGLPENLALDFIVKGLRLKYNPEIPLETYLDVVDGKTARALRKILSSLLEDPLASKYIEKLNARIFDINQQVEELSHSKMGQLFDAVSDIVLYGGNKFIEHQSHKYIRLPEKGLRKAAEWITSKSFDLHAKITGKDWAIAQIYKTRCKLEKCE